MINTVSQVVIAFTSLGILWIGRKAWIQERDERIRRDFQASAFRRRPKVPIMRIGYLIERPDGKPIPSGFAVVEIPGIPAFSAMSDGTTVHDLTFGWTNEELVELVRRRKEFEL